MTKRYTINTASRAKGFVDWCRGQKGIEYANMCHLGHGRMQVVVQYNGTADLSKIDGRARV